MSTTKNKTNVFKNKGLHVATVFKNKNLQVTTVFENKRAH